MGFVVVSSVAGGSLEVKCEESGLSLLPALEALAPHIWQLLWRNTISQWSHLGRHKGEQNRSDVDGCMGREKGHRQ